MECKKCGNTEISEFDYGVEGVGMESNKMYIECLDCNNRVYNPTKEMLKELEKSGEYRR